MINKNNNYIFFCQGLAKSVSLENLSLANCPISDEGLESMYILTITKTEAYRYCQMFGVCSFLFCFSQLFAKVLNIPRVSGTSILQDVTSPGEARSIWPAS